MRWQEKAERLKFSLWLRGWKHVEIVHHRRSKNQTRCSWLNPTGIFEEHFVVKVFAGEWKATDETSVYWAGDIRRLTHRLRWLWWRDVFYQFVSLKKADNLAIVIFGKPALAKL